MDVHYEVRNTNQFDRVRNSTAREINIHIDLVTNRNIQYFSTRPAWEVKKRILALEKEWDVERVLEVNASTLALSGLLLGLTLNRKWLALPALVLPFLLQHGLQGWCPPLPILRRMGIRTQDEIDREKYSLLENLKSRTE